MLIYEKEKVSEFVILLSLYKLPKYLQIRENIFSFFFSFTTIKGLAFEGNLSEC